MSPPLYTDHMDFMKSFSGRLDGLSPKQLATLICQCGPTLEAVSLYAKYRHKLVGWKFILGGQKGAVRGFAVNRQFSGGAVVRSFFKHDKVIFLDDDSAGDDFMHGQRVTIPLDFSIALDTQALSYIEPYLSGNIGKLPKDFCEVFEFLANEEVQVDPIPYLMENLQHLNEPPVLDKIFMKLKAWEVLKSIDLLHFKQTQEIRSTLSDFALMQNAQQSLAFMLYMSDAEKEHLLTHHMCNYCVFLKMIELQLSMVRRSPLEKTIAFITFLHERLATNSFRATMIARSYFERGQTLRFFGKIQSGRKDLFKTVKGMAWDLSQIERTLHMVTFPGKERTRYFLPAEVAPNAWTLGLGRY